MNDAKCQPMRLLKKAAALFVLLTYHACLIAFAGAGVLVLAGAFVERFFYSLLLSFLLVYAASSKKSALSVLYNALLLSCIFSIHYNLGSIFRKSRLILNLQETHSKLHHHRTNPLEFFDLYTHLQVFLSQVLEISLY